MSFSLKINSFDLHFAFSSLETKNKDHRARLPVVIAPTQSHQDLMDMDTFLEGFPCSCYFCGVFQCVCPAKACRRPVAKSANAPYLLLVASCLLPVVLIFRAKPASGGQI
jgi:hypothetical protein